MKNCNTDKEIGAFREIERTALFQQTVEEYVPDAVDGIAKTPLLLTFNGRAAGVVTVDRLDERRMALRAIAIATDLQGQGHGRSMLQLAEAFALARNVRQLCVNADPQKTGFYRSLGFVEETWDPDLLALCQAGRVRPMLVQMVKPL